MRWILALILAVVMAGCRSTRYVAVPEYHTKTVTKTDTVVRNDSVWVKDSVYVYKNGDTMTVTRVVYRDRWHTLYRSVRDTVVRRDSIAYPVTVTATKKEKIFMCSLLWILIGCIVAGVWILTGMLKEANKHEDQ